MEKDFSSEFKYFIEGLDPEAGSMDILRKMFPEKCSKHPWFLKGKHKGKSGTFVVWDLDNRKYGESIELGKTSVLRKEFVENEYVSEESLIKFWAPDIDSSKFNLEDYAIDSLLPKIKVTLRNNKVLNINPAAGEPRQLIFGEEPIEELPMAALYSRSSAYGRLAYSLIYKEQQYASEGGIPSNDNELRKLCELALLNSYAVTSDVINWLGWISVNDISALYSAAMGADEGFLGHVSRL